MGTRSLTTVIETFEDSETRKLVKRKLVKIYRQFDGYPSGMGNDLVEFMMSGKLVNGIGMDKGKVFNGAGCFAAQLIADLKDGVGGTYIYPMSTTDASQYYEYEIICDFDTKEFTFNCYEVGYIGKNGDYISKKRKLFSGNPKDFKKVLELEEED